MSTLILLDYDRKGKFLHGGIRLPRNLIIGVRAPAVRKRSHVGCIPVALWDAAKLGETDVGALDRPRSC